MVNVLWHAIAPDEKAKVEFDLETLRNDLANAQTALSEKEIAINQLVADREGLVEGARLLNETVANLSAKLLSLSKENDLLKSEIERLKLQPTAPIVDRVTRTSLPRIAGFTIEKGKSSPSATLYTQVKTAMKWGAGMGLNYWRGFFNPTEVAQHIGLKASTLGHLPDYGRSLGLRFIADTIDTVLKLIPASAQDPNETALKGYMDGLAKMGAEGVYFNDADNRAIDLLKADVERLRKVAPEMPIFVSLMGSANVDAYKAIVDHVEIQTFGTLADLTRFLQRDVIMCLDVRSPLTAADLKARAETALKTPPKAFFLYADLPTDYDAMPDTEDAVIRDFVTRWKAIMM